MRRRTIRWLGSLSLLAYLAASGLGMVHARRLCLACACGGSVDRSPSRACGCCAHQHCRHGKPPARLLAVCCPLVTCPDAGEHDAPRPPDEDTTAPDSDCGGHCAVCGAVNMPSQSVEAVTVLDAPLVSASLTAADVPYRHLSCGGLFRPPRA